jgi:predicted N-acetyltransferase YhbS
MKYTIKCKLVKILYLGPLIVVADRNSNGISDLFAQEGREYLRSLKISTVKD